MRDAIKTLYEHWINVHTTTPAEQSAFEAINKAAKGQEIWEMLDYAVAFHKGTGTVNYFWDMMAELVKPEDLQILKERAEAIVEGGADK